MSTSLAKFNLLHESFDVLFKQPFVPSYVRSFSARTLHSSLGTTNTHFEDMSERIDSLS